MIGFLQGKVHYFDESLLLLNVSGVGYKVHISRPVAAKISNIGQELTIHTYTHVREDALDLYGFWDMQDLVLFEMLIGVNGIGPKTALGVFAKGSRNEFVKAILDADTSYFEGIPRLGKKNAQKIIIELKNKIGSNKDLDLKSDGGTEYKELLEALKGFGFTTAEASEAIKTVQNSKASMDIKIKLALKSLGR